jgi:hypothetical protein
MPPTVDAGPAPDGAPRQGCPGDVGAGPFTLATGLVNPDWLALDDEDVYWTEGAYGAATGVVKKVPLCGGAVVTLASGQTNPGALALDATRLYWISGGQILKVDKMGGPVSTLQSGTTADDLVVHGSFVYWGAEGPTAEIERTPLAGGAGATVVPGHLVLTSFLAADATSIYWTTGGYEGSLAKAPLAPASGAVTTLASGLFNPEQLVVDATSIYWAEAADDQGDRGNVMRMPTSGGTPVTLFGGLTNPVALARDGAFVYWTNRSASPLGKVGRTAVDGSSTTVIAASQEYPSGLAVGPQNLYWSVWNDFDDHGAILRAAK